MPTLVNNLRAIRGPVTSVPMVGASGVVVEPDTANNQVVVRADETVLFSGDINAATTTGTLSEPITHFSRIRIKYGLRFNNSPKFYDEFPADKIQFFCSKQCYQDGALLTCGGQINISETTATLVTWFQASGTAVTANDGRYYFVVQEIVGINRIANA